jgi:hypothetical protein
MTVGAINTHNELDHNTIKRGIQLGSAPNGTAHDHYLCGVTVYFDCKYPLYISPEMQRYHWFEIITSQSTMHRLKTMVGGENDPFNKYVTDESKAHIRALQAEYAKEPTYENMMRLRSNLPWGFEMEMTVCTNYLQLKTMYHQRKHHRLKEDWGEFVRFCDELPWFRMLTGLDK